MSPWTVICAVVLGCAVTLSIGQRYFRRQKHLPYPLPPGPLGLPFVGNVLGINREAPWLTYAEWAKTYGDIIHSRLLGKDIIIINSEKVAKDLIEGRSRNYSDRPYLVANELFGMDFASILLPYGDKWRFHRRFFHQTFRAESVPRFGPMQQRRASQLLHRLLDKPLLLSEHLFEYSAALILNSVYDYDPVSRKDDMIVTAEKALNVVSNSLRFHIAILTTTFPAVVNLPPWLPGMSFKRGAALAKLLMKRSVEVPFEHCLQKMNDSSSTPSMVYDALRRSEEKGTSPDLRWIQNLQEAAATGVLGDGNQTHEAMMSFFLIMILVPEAQEKAQAQIDAVVGRERLPTIDDRPSLPYVDAILRETLRLRTPAPLGVPHATTNDDVYGGFYIPKGRRIMSVLARSIAHNESKYPNSQEFIPERFLNDDGTLKPDDVENIAFGFGRRICVGRHFADVSLWSAMSKVLSVFKLSKPHAEDGAEIQIDATLSSGVGGRALPFPCSIVPRIPEMDSEKLEQLIAASTV
ncbi:cytochrome P450 [Melanogaster broomeanus]|nr:cytochrome P450 [Melanogaster broomeanus]